METLSFQIQKTDITLTEFTMPRPYLTGHNTDYLCRFTVDDTWSGLLLRATFHNRHTGIKKTHMLLENACYIPFQVLSYGTLEIGIVGLDGDEVIKSSDLYLIPVRHDAGENDEDFPDPDPTVMDELLKIVASINAEIQNAYKGEKGDPFTFDDFTQEQLELLRGPKGNPFTFSDFTAEQLESLRGERGLKGDTGDPFRITKTYKSIADMEDDFSNPEVPLGAFVLIASNTEDIDNAKLYVKAAEAFVFLTDLSGSQGIRGEQGEQGDRGLRGPEGVGVSEIRKDENYHLIVTLTNGVVIDVGNVRGLQGEKGDAFTYSDFTPAQLESLRGPQGNAFTYADFTSEQLEALKVKGDKGDTGDAFTFSDFTQEQLESLKVKGDAFVYEDFTPEQLEALKVKGDKGDAFTYADFTEAQLNALKVKGDKGDPLTWNDLTTAQKESLKGEKGDKGEPFRYSDFTQQQLESLRGQQGIQGVPGKPFQVAKTYASISAMNADFENPEVEEGDFVMISSNEQDQDNAKLYVKGASAFAFITDLSGAQGIQGDRGIQGIQGERGLQGVGISAATLDANGYLTLTYTDGSSSSPLYVKGETGQTGPAYTLTTADKNTIVAAVLSEMVAAEGVSY